jgi:hypothetical protein
MIILYSEDQRELTIVFNSIQVCYSHHEPQTAYYDMVTELNASHGVDG